MEEAANAGYVVILDKGSIVAEGTPFELKNEYVQDTMSVYGVTEEEIKTLAESIKDPGWLSVKSKKYRRGYPADRGTSGNIP